MMQPRGHTNIRMGHAVKQAELSSTSSSPIFPAPLASTNNNNTSTTMCSGQIDAATAIAEAEAVSDRKVATNMHLMMNSAWQRHGSPLTQSSPPQDRRHSCASRLATSMMIDKAITLSNNKVPNSSLSPTAEEVTSPSTRSAAVAGAASSSSSSLLAPYSQQDYCSIFDGTSKHLQAKKRQRPEDRYLANDLRSGVAKVATKNNKGYYRENFVQPPSTMTFQQQQQQLQSRTISTGYQYSLFQDLHLKKVVARGRSRSVGTTMPSPAVEKPIAEPSSSTSQSALPASCASTPELYYGYEDPDQAAAAMPSRRMSRRMGGGPARRRGSVTKFSSDGSTALALLHAAKSSENGSRDSGESRTRRRTATKVMPSSSQQNASW